MGEAVGLVDGGLTFVSGIGLHLWGQSRVASRMPVLISNQRFEPIEVDVVPCDYVLSYLTVEFRSKVFKHGSEPRASIRPGMFHEFNLPTNNEEFTLFFRNAETSFQMRGSRGDVIIIPADRAFDVHSVTRIR